MRISEFETSNAGYGTVIQYGDEFYYIFLENNYSMKIYDGVRIYKLGENMEHVEVSSEIQPCFGKSHNCTFPCFMIQLMAAGET